LGLFCLGRKVHGGIFAAAVDLELEIEPVAFVERWHSGALDGRDMDEGVGLAVIALNEAEALHRVEELDRAAGLFARQLTLRPTGTAASSTATTAALDSHRLTLDSKIGRRNPSAAVDERELERLAVCKVGQSRLLDGRDVNEHILAAIIANDEAKALLRVEELDDALALANYLRGHSATAAAAAPETTAASAAAAEATASTAAAAKAAAITETATATIAAAATAASAAVAAALLKAAAKISTESRLIAAETVALVAAAPTAVPLAPSIETHAPSELEFSPPTPQTNALGPNGATGHGA